MSLTPQDIEGQVFREKFKGYDQEEVDTFLDRVSERLTELLREREEMAARVERVERDAAESVEAERLLKRTLITAQRTADETVAEAVAQANTAVTEGERRAQEIVADAQARAGEIIADAQRRADDLVATRRREAEARQAAAEEELDRIRTAVAELHRFGGEYKERVRAVVAEQLTMLDRAGDMPEVPPEMARLLGTAEHGREEVTAEPQVGDAEQGLDTIAARPAGSDSARQPLRPSGPMNEEQP